MIRHLLLLLTLSPLLLASCGDNATRGTDTVVSGQAAQWFKEVTEELGIDFIHETGATGELWLPEIMGGGVGMFDFDNDGRLDVYLVNCNDTLPEAHSPTEGALTNRLYRQLPDGTFEDETAESGLGDTGYGMGVAIGDIDNDGFVDVYVTNIGADQLYRNEGEGTFANITQQAGIDVPGWSCSATFFDANLDGHLDLYITQYVHFDPQRKCYDATGRLAYCSPTAHPPATDVLLMNNGDGTFTDVSQASGIASVAAAGLGVVVDDFNADGLQDVYVANDGYANNLWINQGDNTFRDVAVLWGAAYNMHGRPEAGMGIVAADFRNVGLLDLFMTHLNNESNTLYRNRGIGQGFDDVSATTGLATNSLPWTGFGVAALDVTLDGWLDLIVVNGRVTAGPIHPGSTLAAPWNEYGEPNHVYRNDGQGRFFTVQGPAAEFAKPLDISRGLAVGDLNDNGMLDFIVANIQGRPRLYRNDAPREGHWLIVRAVDPRFNRDAIGARVHVVAGSKRLMRTINSGYSYLSASDFRVHFGLGEHEVINAIEVHWPDGLKERFTEIQVDRVIELRRGEGEATS